MNKSILAIPALALLAACADPVADPLQPPDPAALPAWGSAPLRVGAQGSGSLSYDASRDANVIDFESLAASGTSYTMVPSYSEDGFTLMNPGYSGTAAFSSPQSGNALFQGSAALLNNLPDGVTLLSRDDGGPFTVASIDLAELRSSDVTPREVPFTGTRADGSTVTATLTTDGAPGFETFALGGFADLVSLSWVQVAPFHQFDNIVVALAAAGPETKDDCRDGGWADFGFVNQGQCVRMVETGKDSR